MIKYQKWTFTELNRNVWYRKWGYSHMLCSNHKSFGPNIAEQRKLGPVQCMASLQSQVRIYIWCPVGVRTLRNTLRTRFSCHVEDHLFLQSRVLQEVVVLPLDFSISTLLGNVHDGVLHSPVSWESNGYHECECAGILADWAVLIYKDIFLSGLDSCTKALTQWHCKKMA